MLAEEHAPKTFVGEKSRRGALDAQFFQALAALALEFVRGKCGVAREIVNHREQLFRKFRKSGNRDGARIRARHGAETCAHAPQILFNLAAGARICACANHARSQLREIGRLARHERITGVEK